MDKKYNKENWVGSMFQRFEAVCQEVDEFVHKDTVKYVENHMQTVGESVKKFYSGVVQDILPPLVEPVQQVAQSIPSKRIDLVETVVGIKENTVDSNTNKSEDATLFPTEKQHKPSSTSLCHSELISCVITGNPIEEGDNQINKTSDKAIQVHLNSNTSSQEDFMMERSLYTDVSSPKHDMNKSEPVIHIGCIDEKCDDDHSAKISCQSLGNRLDNRSFEEKGMLCNTSIKFDASVFEDADWGIDNIFDLNLGIAKKIDGEPSPCPSEDVNVSADGILFPFVEEKSEKVPMETFVSGLGINCSQEKKTLLNRSIDEFENDLNTSICDQSSELKSSITCKENKEEEASHIFADGLLPANLSDSSSELAQCNLAQFEASVSCSEIGTEDGSNEDPKMDTIDLSDMKQPAKSRAEGKKLFAFPYGSGKSKSYKKIIQDAFTSRKRLTKEYKQLAIWYGDIEKELCDPTEENQVPNMGIAPNSPARDLCDSEWEIL